MRTLLRLVVVLALTGIFACGRDRSSAAGDQERTTTAAETSGGNVTPPVIPDEELVDQHGRRVKLYTDVVKGHVVVVDFVFTRCTTICSPMTATLARAHAELAARGVTDARFVSISLDPTNDTPARLAEFASRFGVRDQFWFLTGDPASVERARKAFQGAGVDKETHGAVFLVGNEATRRWHRIFGLVAPTVIAEKVLEVRGADRGPEKKAAEAPRKDVDAGASARAANSYFPDVELVDQDGKPHRFYSDLVKGKTVLVNFGFTRCKGACSPIMRNLAKVQRALGDRVGKDIVMLTISVDPRNDTPAKMTEFGSRYGYVPRGWYLLTGTPANVEAVLQRLGGSTAVPDEHSSVVLIGDDKTGTWTKAVGFVPADEIVHAVLHLNDGG